MKFYLGGLGNYYESLEFVKDAIIEADRLGFDGALMPDHYMWGEMMGHRVAGGYSTVDTWMTLTYLAAKTEQIKLGTLVTPIPFRPPAMLAKMLSTLDVLSGGRVVLGVGAGWSQVEFDGYSVWDGAKVRVDKTEEGLKLILRLWTEDEVTFKGKYYEAKGAVVKPKPVQKPYPKLLFGGTGKRMLSMAGRYGDIVYIPPWSGANIPEMRARVLRAAEAAGRADKMAFMGGEMGSLGGFDFKEARLKVERAWESGSTYYLTSFPREGYKESMHRFAEEIISSYR